MKAVLGEPMAPPGPSLSFDHANCLLEGISLMFCGRRRARVGKKAVSRVLLRSPFKVVPLVEAIEYGLDDTCVFARLDLVFKLPISGARYSRSRRRSASYFAAALLPETQAKIALDAPGHAYPRTSCFDLRWKIALEEMADVRKHRVAFATMLADSGHGAVPNFVAACLK